MIATERTDLQQQLFKHQDLKYKLFQQKLIPSIDPDTVIGVRTPQLRKFAREFAKTPQAIPFLNSTPHQYFEENNLHAFVIELMPDFNEAMAFTGAFLPYIDNWATCDSFSPKIFKKHPAETYKRIKLWLRSDHVYTVRYGTGLLLGNFLDGEFLPEMIELVAELRSDEYYVNMMIAWYFATALVKQYEAALPVLLDKRLAPWTHNKAIRKAIESYRVSPEKKEFLRKLKCSIKKNGKHHRSSA